MVGLILVDPPINNAYKYRRSDDEKVHAILLQTRLFRDGDTCGIPSPSDAVSNSDLFEPSLSEMLKSYWMKRPVQDFNSASPSLFTLSCHPLKVVAMEWMTYSELMYHSIKHYEYSAETIPPALERIEVLSADLSALQQWIRRGMATTEKIRHVIHFLKSLSISGRDKDESALLLEDYEQLAYTIDTSSRRLEAMVTIASSLIQAIDCRRSLTQTANISRLTYLALSFIPLTFVSGLFSMNEKIAPGGSMFWLYFAVSIPLCLLVFVIVRPPILLLEMAAAYIARSVIRQRHVA